MKLISTLVLTVVITMLFTITSYALEKAAYIDTIRLYLTTLEIKETHDRGRDTPDKRRLEVIKNNLKEIINQDPELLGAQYILNKLNNPNYTLDDFIKDVSIQSNVRKESAHEWAYSRMSMLPEFSGYGASRLLLAEIKFRLFLECSIAKSDDLCSFNAGLAELIKYGIDTVSETVWEHRSYKPSQMVIETLYEDPMAWVYPVQYRNNR